MSSPIHQLSSRRFNIYPGNKSFETFSDFEPLISRRPFTAVPVQTQGTPKSRPSSGASNLLPRRARTAPPRLSRKQDQGLDKKSEETPKKEDEEKISTEDDIAAFSQHIKNIHHASLGSFPEGENGESEADAANRNEETAKAGTDDTSAGVSRESTIASKRQSRTPTRTPTRTQVLDEPSSSRRGSKVIVDPRLIYDRESEKNTVLDDETVQPGWLKRRNCYGFPYYEEQETESETWEKPLVLPKFWEERCDDNGFTYYIDCKTGFISWEKPEILPSGWERQTSSDGRLYYLHYHTDISSWDKPNVNTLQTLQSSTS
ncbi:NEDD4-like E3 ubiquitin-protein ligase WWP1 [Ptychodera flava]|uniref:NEDD4-like E3 ubiquitin-protein ligase WWP1 n=1 Tax=Ptychodera flava TaxID=63121 RepID=UPI003969D78B